MKDKKLYYECVMQCQMGYMYLDHRRERYVNDQAQMCLHERTFYPENPYDKKKPAMILCLDRPLAKRYTQEVKKVVKRRNLRTNEVEEKETHSKIKFRLMDPDEITTDVKGRAVYMQLRECDLEPEAVKV